MRKLILFAVLLAAMPLTTMAQDDDLYFNPKQEAKKEAALREQKAKAWAQQVARRDSIYAIYWSGSPRSVDEYNRNGRILSHYQGVTTDSLGNDIISFRLDKGIAPDSIYDDAAFAQKYISQDEDFEYTRGLSRWDGYYNPWFYDYYGVGPYYWRSAYWGWRNPWRYGYYAGWYDPWFDPFYDPWYYGYAGWYDPWYYGCGGYYSPWFWGGPVYSHVSYRGSNSAGYAGSRSFRFNSGEGNRYGNANNNNYTYRSNSNRSFGGRTDNSNSRYNTTRSNNNNTSFSRSDFGGFGNRSGASFGGGGTRSGGGFSGGARSGGGFGGRR